MPVITCELVLYTAVESKVGPHEAARLCQVDPLKPLGKRKTVSDSTAVKLAEYGWRCAQGAR